jgi:hypothetical protein
MGRKPSGKPWLHSPTAYWCVTLDGRREYTWTVIAKSPAFSFASRLRDRFAFVEDAQAANPAG